MLPQPLLPWQERKKSRKVLVVPRRGHLHSPSHISTILLSLMAAHNSSEQVGCMMRRSGGGNFWARFAICGKWRLATNVFISRVAFFCTKDGEENKAGLGNLIAGTSASKILAEKARVKRVGKPKMEPQVVGRRHGRVVSPRAVACEQERVI